MPNRCCVPLCKGNYPTGPSVRLFSFPKEEGIKKLWLAALKRKNFVPTVNNKVCEQHFLQSDFETDASAYDERIGTLVKAKLHLPRLKKGTVPSVFPNYPSYYKDTDCHNRESPNSKKKRLENDHLKSVLEVSLQERNDYEAKRKLFTLDDVHKCVKNIGLPDKWVVNCEPNLICLLYIEVENSPCVKYSIKINDELQVSAYLKYVKLERLTNKYTFPYKTNNFDDVIDILSFFPQLEGPHALDSDVSNTVAIVADLLRSISTEDNQSVIDFVIEQLQLLIMKKNNLRYSCDVIVLSSLLYTISPHAYKFLRKSGNLIMPHPDTLRNVCSKTIVSPESEQYTDQILRYMKHRFPYLNDKDKTVILLMDEIHMKAYFDYKGGTIVGNSYNTADAATSAYVFMVSSMLSTFKEVAHILPVKTINHTSLNAFLKKIIIGLENIGFNVICVVSDNNAINQKAMSLFSEPPQLSFVYPHPVDKNRPLFFIIDSVHLLKCIRNNWLNQRNSGKSLLYPNFPGYVESEIMSNTASFDSLKVLYNIECRSLVTYNLTLTSKALSPSNLERQNVKLTLKVFDKFVAQALLELGNIHNIPNYHGTSKFISIIIDWWHVVNVKTPFKGVRSRDKKMAPLTNSLTDSNLDYLYKFVDWLDLWKAKNSKTNTQTKTVKHSNSDTQLNHVNCPDTDIQLNTVTCSDTGKQLKKANYYDIGSLSKETHDALRQTSQGIIELCHYCCNELGMQYILPGKVQTDALEERFGKYRQLAGSQYHVSLRQILESEKKLRLQSTLHLQVNKKQITISDIDVSDEWDRELGLSTADNAESRVSIVIHQSEITHAKTYLPVLTYIGGYCCFKIIKKLKCSECTEKLIENTSSELDDKYKLIESFDRGGLSRPNILVVNTVLYNYIIINKLYSDFQTDFLKQKNQRAYSVATTLSMLEASEMLDDDTCSHGHSGRQVTKMVVWISTNVILKNMCGRKNDEIATKPSGKKRKFQTLTKV